MNKGDGNFVIKIRRSHRTYPVPYSYADELKDGFVNKTKLMINAHKFRKKYDW